jgi:hypothetical protein
MDHRPFEDWLLENKRLTNNEKQQLNEHMRGCPSCSALAEVDLALKSVRLATPAAGFTDRFQVRLETSKKASRRKIFWGFFVLTVSVLGLLTWVSWPVLAGALQSPVNLLASWLTSLIAIWANLQALLQSGSVLVKVLPGFIPNYIWAIGMFIAGAWILLWVLSLMKFSKIPQGV